MNFPDLSFQKKKARILTGCKYILLVSLLVHRIESIPFNIILQSVEDIENQEKCIYF